MNDKGIAKIADFGFAKKSLYSSFHTATNPKKKNTMLAVPSTCRQKPSKRTSTPLKMISGLSESWFLRCSMDKPLGIAEPKLNWSIK